MDAFYLDVQQISEICHFQLRWAQGQQLVAQVPYPTEVFQCYETWHNAYLSFYQNFRARPGFSGTGVLPKIDWRSRLVQAEPALLNAFHGWLNQAELLPLRGAIAQQANSVSHPMGSDSIDLFLTCGTTTLERLPWETWELGKEFPMQKRLRIWLIRSRFLA